MTDTAEGRRLQREFDAAMQAWEAIGKPDTGDEMLAVSEARLARTLYVLNNLPALLSAAEAGEKMREALEKIKEKVCGDKHPRWADDWATTGTRGVIADIIDAALAGAP